MKGVLDTNVSIFKSYSNTSGKNIPLMKWLTSSKHYASQKDAALWYGVDDQEYKRLKSSLPCITPSCADVAIRQKNEDFTHTGLIAIDIDGKDNPQISDWAAMREKVGGIVNVAYCGLSISGHGLWCLIPIAHPDKHVEHFNLIERFFKNKLNVVIDPSCKNVMRLRGYSFDPDAYINPNAETLKFFQPNSPLKGKSRLNRIKNANTAIEEMPTVLATVENIEALGVDIAPAYDDYIKCAFALADSFGADGEELFLRVCAQHHGHDEDAAIRKYRNAVKTNTGQIGIASFYHLCHVAGVNTF